VERVVVIGASLAGLRAAQAVRAAGHESSLVVVGDERRLPYTRPPLSKQLLAGEQTSDDCAFPGTDAVAGEWRLGSPAVAVDRERKSVALAAGDAIPYDRLIVATGSRARAWPGDGAALRGVHTLRAVEDALALRAALTAGPQRLAIVGAGFIGCEVAATTRKRGIDVTLIDVAPQPMVPLGPELGARCAELHMGHGVDLRLGTGVTGLRGTEPFHWSGDESSFGQLMNDVFVTRMSGSKLTDASMDAMLSWIDAQPRPLRPAATNAAAVQRGAALFNDATNVACVTCHSGARFSNNSTVDVGTGQMFQVPSLLGIGTRGPFMHDGCAATLRDRFNPACGGDKHGITGQLSPAQIDDLIAYLNTL